MRRLELVSLKDIQRRVEDIKASLENIYGVALSTGFGELLSTSLFPTEAFLEEDKLALLFMKIVKEGYDVPIITVRYRGDVYILDGHHRAYILRKLMRDKIRGYVLSFPSGQHYRDIPKFDLEDIAIKEVVPIDDPILRTWAQILTLLKYYEAIYNVFFRLKEEEVELNLLVPTQPYVTRSQVDLIEELLVPIACVQQQGRFYILDGHARSLHAKETGLKTIHSMVLEPQVEVDFGIVRTTKRMNLSGLEDIKVKDA